MRKAYLFFFEGMLEDKGIELLLYTCRKCESVTIRFIDCQ